MSLGKLKAACMQATIDALKQARENKIEYLKTHSEIPESEYDKYVNHDHMPARGLKRTLRLKMRPRSRTGGRL